MATLTTVESLAERLQNNPYSLAFSRLADHYRKAGDIDQAIDVCAKGLERHPDCITGHIVLGRCYLEQKRLENAVSAFMNVCRMDRRNITAIKMLADIFMRQGLSEKAGDLYSLLLKIDPRNPLLANIPSRNKGTGSNDLFKILELTPAATSAAFNPGRTVILENLPAGAASGVDKNASLKEPGFLFESVQATADAGAAAEEMLTEATTITGSDISDRMSALFGEKPSAAAKAKTPPVPTPPPQETVTSFEVRSVAGGTAVAPRREDAAAKETIKMPAISEPPKNVSPLEVELEETMIIDADATSLIRGESGTRTKDSSAFGALKPPSADTKTQEILKETIAQPADTLAAEELIEKPQESLDELLSDMKKAAPPPEEATTEVHTAALDEETISGDDVVERLEGIFKEKKEKHKKIVKAKAEPKPQAAMAEERTATLPLGMPGENDVEKTATFLPSADDTISGDDVVERLEGIFKDKKRKQKKDIQKPVPEPAANAVSPTEKKEENATFNSAARNAVTNAPPPPAPATDAQNDGSESAVETVSAESEMGPLPWPDEFSSDSTSAKNAGEGPERTVVELVPSKFFDSGADPTDRFEETLIMDTPADIRQFMDKKPEQPAEKKLPASEGTPSMDDTIGATRLDDAEIAGSEAENKKESTAVFEDFSPPPEAPALGSEPAKLAETRFPRVLDISADIDNNDNPDDLPDQVLTPTLANIFLQQGQLRSAMKIYQRLAEKDPDNKELARQIEVLQKAIAEGIANLKPPKPRKSRARKKAPNPAEATGQQLPAGDTMPPVNVRIRKKPKLKPDETAWGQE